ncbi:unnamed protein product [Lactuca virosa]|uniref:Peroxidase n=1 Tax=Lactuca virosa TaxID=75947 RepID=A0AAU9LH36_9ASTR|nr:unnamed protein product [Lactuca virosa]
MARRRSVLHFLITLVVLAGAGKGQLVENFYAGTCPMVEAIVRQTVVTKVGQTFTTIPATLRLFFHDCFVEGCDASVMISSPNGDAEKDAEDNLSLAGDGFDTVIKAKQAVESVCPGVVSCADVLAIAARDVVAQAGGPLFNVELGRRDGLISQASRVAGNLPDPTFNLIQLNTMFAKKQPHRTSHASTVDPSLNPTYAQQLMAACPQNVDPDIAIDMDPETPRTFDNIYYQNLIAGKGLFTSDEVLFTDSSSQPTVNDFANSPGDFNAAFVTAMRKLGRTGIKIGIQGEIRRDCTSFN